MIRKRFKVVIYALIFALLMIVASIVVIVLQRKQNTEIKQNMADLQAKISQSSVYTAIKPINAGDKITEDNVQLSQLSTFDTALTDVYMTKDQLGEVARINIDQGAPVQKTMLAESDITKDTRVYECSVVNIATDQLGNDADGKPNAAHDVDIRILFPDGTDYIVLAKKHMYDLNGTIFNMHLSEDELLRMNSATVDAATLGARLYTTRYVENTLQDEATPFYPVKQATLDLISSDPNVLEMAQETLSTEVRQDLEERMLALKGEAENGNAQMSADFKSQITVTGPDGTADTEESSADTTETAASTDTTTTETTAAAQ
jgi:virulence-associated protein VapD